MSTFVETLGPVRELDLDRLREAMAQIPDEIRAKLAEGPSPYRYTCAVCNAFGERWYKTAVADLSDPMWIVFAWHEVPKIDMKHADDQWYGPHARAVFKRCRQTYIAAGWEAPDDE